MGGGGGSKDITYNLVGDDREKLQAFAEKIKEENHEKENHKYRFAGCYGRHDGL